MSEVADADRRQLTAATLVSLAAALEEQPGDAWDRPSMCEGWRVREAVAHMTMAARYSEAEFMSLLTAEGFDFTKLSDRLAIEDGARSPAQLIADLRSEQLRGWTPPGGGWAGALSHAVIHSLDVTAALQLSPAAPDAALVAVLDDLTAGGVHRHFGTDIDGQHFVATDLDWSFGSGAAVTATAGELALTLSGRR